MQRVTKIGFGKLWKVSRCFCRHLVSSRWYCRPSVELWFVFSKLWKLSCHRCRPLVCSPSILHQTHSPPLLHPPATQHVHICISYHPFLLHHRTTHTTTHDKHTATPRATTLSPAVQRISEREDSVEGSGRGLCKTLDTYQGRECRLLDGVLKCRAESAACSRSSIEIIAQTVSATEERFERHFCKRPFARYLPFGCTCPLLCCKSSPSDRLCYEVQ